MLTAACVAMTRLHDTIYMDRINKSTELALQLVIFGMHARMQVISNVSGKTLPARIGCTGFAEGGALAKMAATWAGAAYANAETRSIVFGAPQIGDARCVHMHSLPICIVYFQSASGNCHVADPRTLLRREPYCG